MRRVHVFGLTLALCAELGGTARADWEVKRAPDDPRVTDALLGALLAAPDDRGALRRLVAHGGIARLAQRCESRARGMARLACGHLRAEAGDAAAALLRFAEAAAAAPDEAAPRHAAGRLLAKQGRADEALVELEAALARARPVERTAILEALLPLYPLARIPPAESRRKSAVAAANALLSARPADASLRRRAADVLAGLGESSAAATLLRPLAKSARDPWVRLPLLFRIAELERSAGLEAEEAATLDQLLDLLPSRDARRREALRRLVDVERRRERLGELAERWSALPEGRRDAAVEEELGRILDERGDSSRAQQHLARAIRLDPRAVGARRLLIRAYTRAGDEDAAIAELRRLANASRGDARVELELAERLYARVQGRAEALALAAALGRRHRDATTHAALAALYDKWGERDRALAEQTLLTRLEPDDPEHLIALGELFEQRGDKAAALQTWRRLAPGPAPKKAALLRLVDVLAEHDRPGEALQLLERLAHERSLESTATDRLVERRMADVLDRLHRDGEAEAIYRRLLDAAVKSEDAGAIRELGPRWLELALRHNGEDRELGELAHAAEPPTSAARVEVLLLVARGRIRQGRALEAERLLRDLAGRAALGVDRGRALEALSELLASRSGVASSEAVDLLVQAAVADPARAPRLYTKASERAAALYRDEDALRYAERAVALAPLDADAHERLGSLCEPRDTERALGEYDRALELDGTRDRLRLRAAELALRRGDDSGAAARYRALLSRARDEQAIEEASRRAVVVHELTGRLGELEREIAPSATAADGRASLRRLLVEIDRRYVPQLAARAEAGDTNARAELRRIAGHALAPLLDSVVDGEREERRTAVQLLGELGARGAAPLLLRLAAGEAARRGAEPPPTALRTAAAEAAAWLITAEDLPWLDRIAADAEQRIRVAAAVGLARIGRDPRAQARLVRLLGDDHDRVAAVACLGLGDAPALGPDVLGRIDDRIFDAARPLAARACAVTMANQVERAASSRALELLRRWPQRLGQVAASPGAVRALLATGDAALTTFALERALVEPGLSRMLLADGLPAAHDEELPRAAGAVDLPAWLASRESLPAPRPHPGVSAAVVAMVESEATSAQLREALLSDLTDPDGLVAHLASSEDTREARAAARVRVLDDSLAGLASLARDGANELERTMAVSLLTTRPSGVPRLLQAGPAEALPAGVRRSLVVGLGDPQASELSDADAESLLPVLRAFAKAVDWRARRAALACLSRQPRLAGRLAAELTALRADHNPLVK